MKYLSALEIYDTSSTPEELVANNPRIERYLAQTFEDVSRNHFARLCDQQKIKINGNHAHRGTRVRPQDEIEILDDLTPIMPGPERVEIEIAKLKILFEDQHFILVSKPRAMHSILQRKDDPMTLADLLVAHCPDLVHVGNDAKEGGLVQRLDYYTHGLMVVAKKKEVWNFLHQQFKESKIKKNYRCLVHGVGLKHGFELGEDIRVLKSDRLGDVSLVEVECRAGSRHVVRKSFAKCGHPLVGDQEYGSPRRAHPVFHDTCVKEQDGFYLHAVTISGDFSANGSFRTFSDSTIGDFFQHGPLIGIRERLV